MRFVDSHAHPQFADFDADRAEILGRMRAAEVGAIAVGTDRPTSIAAAKLAQTEPDIWAVVGFHPNELPTTPDDFSAIESLAQSEPVVGVGETGLDYFRSTDLASQQEWFTKHLQLARSVRKPVVVHLRDKADTYHAYDDALKMLKHFHGLNFVLHCYSGDAARAARAMELGGYISFTGIVTFRNAQALREVAKQVPLERTLIETDAPYLAPEPHRGGRNEPAFVTFVAETLAELHRTSVDIVAKQTTQNALRLFGLKK